MKNSTASASTGRRPPRNEKELLEQEDFLARKNLRASARALGEDLVGAVELRTRIVEHPLFAMAASACSGFFLARPISRVIGWRELRAGTEFVLRFAGMGVVGKVLGAWLPEGRHHRPF